MKTIGALVLAGLLVGCGGEVEARPRGVSVEGLSVGEMVAVSWAMQGWNGVHEKSEHVGFVKDGGIVVQYVDGVTSCGGSACAYPGVIEVTWKPADSVGMTVSTLQVFYQQFDTGVYDNERP